MRHRNYEIWKDVKEDSNLFSLDSSFKIVPALWGGSPNISFESVNYPGQYLRHCGWVAFINKNDGKDLFFKDASFRPHSDSQMKFESLNYPNHFLRHQNGRVRISNFESSKLEILTLPF